MEELLRPIRRALISVSDKTGIVEFAEALAMRKVEIISTGGTAKLLRSHGIAVVEVADYTGFPEMMDGRVKTLHPLIHGGILGRRGTDDEVMREHGINPIDLVAVNLYPFVRTVASPDCTLEQAVENIDIGGPAMVRAAAKNNQDVTVVVRAADYHRIIDEMDAHDGALTRATRLDLAVAAFEHTAAYDSAIANYFGTKVPDYGISDGTVSVFPRTLNLNFKKLQNMRYGENPHQKAAFYAECGASGNCISTAKQLQGKELSYNNIADTDAAIECVRQFAEPCCVIVKHANPCGAALGSDLKSAYEGAFACDPESAFGGIIAFNRTLDAAAAKAIVDRQFCEVIVAPFVTAEARTEVARKKNVRLLEIGELEAPWPRLDCRKVTGGLLVQEADLISKMDNSMLKVVTKRAPQPEELEELQFAWKICKFTKSNAIVYTAGKRTLGIGCGQTSRVFSARIAKLRAEEAGLSLKGCALASDAFFPFRDGVDAAAAAGVSCIIQPGGSIRDQEVIDAANEHGIAMVFTGIRHFRH